VTEPDAPAVAHVMPEYLSRTATYIYNVVRLQREFAPVVLAERTVHRDEFPLEHPVVALGDGLTGWRPRLRAGAGGVLRGRRRLYELAISDEVGRHGCVLIHAHHGWSGRDAVRAAVRNDVPLVTTFYGRDLALRRGRRDFRPPYSLLFSRGSRFVCEGPAMADHLVALGAPRERISLVKIGIEIERFPFRPRERVRPLIVVQAARFMEKKGFDLTIRAYAAAVTRLGLSELWLVGDGELRPELEALVSRLGITDRVRFLGSLSYDEYQEVIAKAHLCVQPSRTARDGDTEGGAPTVLLEMQAVGVPVVATRHADIPFVVHDDEWLVPEEDVDALADALERAAGITDAEYRARLEAARAYVERDHDAAGMAAAIESVYAEALSAPSPAFLRTLEEASA
jgi:colanic acid/amylovoran biosynthesis glycosyltransferase